MPAIHAPYNFVPLSRNVFTPSWDKDITHDKPFSDGYCGHLDLTLTAETPILVGGVQRPGTGGCTVASFHELPDGRYAIPGASLKGMVRSVMEIVAFGKMQRVTDQQLSIRDLTGKARPFYADRVNGKQKAGWLRLENGRWTLYPCTYIAVHRSELENIDPLFAGVLAKAKASERYNEQFTQNLRNLTYPHLYSVAYNRDTETIRPTRGAPFDKPVATNLRHGADGFIVYTGHVPRKEREFIFSSPTSAGIAVTGDVMKRFGAAHRSNPQNRNTDYDWYMKQGWMNLQPGIPVFYIADQGGTGAAHIGLALMFRISYDKSIHDTIRAAQPQFDSEEGFDLAECLFGRVATTGKHDLKSRVSFLDAVAMDDAQPTSLQNTVLSSPKASFYPAYLRQNSDGEGNLTGASYTTYSSSAPQVRGWKRYPVSAFRQEEVSHFTRNANPVGESVQIQLQPLPAGTSFKARVTFHNLKRAELGALLWVLTWGGDAAKRHSIGLGKPLGMGMLRLEISDTRLLPNKPEAPQPPLDELMADFSRSLMEGLNEAPTLPMHALPEVQQLLHMADPSYGRLQNLTYMPLTEFRESKGGNGNRAQVLRPYVPANRLAEIRAETEAMLKQLAEDEKAREEKVKQDLKEAERIRLEKEVEGLSAEAKEIALLFREYDSSNADLQREMTRDISKLVEKATTDLWPLELRQEIVRRLEGKPYTNSSKKGKDRKKLLSAMLQAK